MIYRLTQTTNHVFKLTVFNTNKSDCIKQKHVWATQTPIKKYRNSSAPTRFLVPQFAATMNL